jgi:hypothetical protein
MNFKISEKSTMFIKMIVTCICIDYIKVKVKMFLCLIKHYAMKAHGGVEV